MSFEMIPCIYAGDLPNDVENELRDWNDELCLHGDGGCVFSVYAENMKEIPLFVAWMIKIGAWTVEQTNLPCYDNFCKEMGFNSGEPYHFKEFNAKIGNANLSLSVAMTGT